MQGILIGFLGLNVMLVAAIAIGNGHGLEFARGFGAIIVAPLAALWLLGVIADRFSAPAEPEDGDPW